MQEIETIIRTMDVKEAYNFLAGEENVDPKIYEQARYGVDLKVDIYDYISGNMMIKQKKGVVMYKGKVYPLETLYTEMEKRLRLIRNFLLKRHVGKGVGGVLPDFSGSGGANGARR